MAFRASTRRALRTLCEKVDERLKWETSRAVVVVLGAEGTKGEPWGMRFAVEMLGGGIIWVIVGGDVVVAELGEGDGVSKSETCEISREET